MRGIEFFRNVSIGQYHPGETLVHRLTPATKYLWLLALMIPGALGGPIGVAFVLAVSLLAGLLAGVRPGFLLRGVKPALPFFLLAALLQFLFGFTDDGSGLLFALGPFHMTARHAAAIGMAIERTVALMVLLGVFTSVTSEGEVAHGVEDFLAPLGRIGLPVHELSMIVSVTFRFIPIIAMELETIAKAQASRGANFGTGKGGPLRKARDYLPLIVPVTVRALERAEILAEAMEARRYTGAARTRLVMYQGIRGEGAFRVLALVSCAAAFALGAIH
jgi:energy-coupling factor transport system permease protein